MSNSTNCEGLLLKQIQLLEPQKSRVCISKKRLFWQIIKDTVETVKGGNYKSAITETPDEIWIDKKLLLPKKESKISDHWTTTPTGKRFLKTAFAKADLPEIKKKDLEPGTYTNLEIAERTKSVEYLAQLLVMFIDELPEEKRALLSFAVKKI